MAIHYNKFETLKYCLSKEIYELIKEYNEKYNKDKDYWDENGLVDEINNQFTNYSLFINNCCEINTVEMLEYILSLTNEYNKKEAMELCIKNKNLKCLDVLIKNGCNLITYNNLYCIYINQLQNNDYIKKKIKEYDIKELEKVYDEDINFKLIRDVSYIGIKNIYDLFDSGYRLTMQNENLDSICQYFIKNRSNIALDVIKYYKEKNLDNSLFGQYELIFYRENIEGNTLFDTFMDIYFDSREISEKLFTIIVNDKYYKRILIDNNIVRKSKIDGNKERQFEAIHYTSKESNITFI